MTLKMVEVRRASTRMNAECAARVKICAWAYFSSVGKVMSTAGQPKVDTRPTRSVRSMPYRPGATYQTYLPAEDRA